MGWPLLNEQTVRQNYRVLSRMVENSTEDIGDLGRAVENNTEENGALNRMV